MTGPDEPPTSRGVKDSVGLRLISLFVLAMIASCNPPADYALVGSAYVPAAHGDIEIEKIDKEQILVTLALDHLVPPERVELATIALVRSAETRTALVRSATDRTVLDRSAPVRSALINWVWKSEARLRLAPLRLTRKAQA